MTEEKLGEVIISVDTPDKKKSKMPLLPLRDVVFFPGDYLPVFVGRRPSVNAIELSINKFEGKIFLIAQKDPRADSPKPKDLYQTGVVAKISEPRISQDGAVKLMVVVESRAKAEQVYEEDSMLFAEVDV